jgi:hypothetical protein
MSNTVARPQGADDDEQETEPGKLEQHSHHDPVRDTLGAVKTIAKTIATLGMAGLALNSPAPPVIAILVIGCIAMAGFLYLGRRRTK